MTELADRQSTADAAPTIIEYIYIVSPISAYKEQIIKTAVSVLFCATCVHLTHSLIWVQHFAIILVCEFEEYKVHKNN